MSASLAPAAVPKIVELAEILRDTYGCSKSKTLRTLYVLAPNDYVRGVIDTDWRSYLLEELNVQYVVLTTDPVEFCNLAIVQFRENRPDDMLGVVCQGRLGVGLDMRVA